MEFIFIFFKNGITFLAQHEIFVWCGCFAVVFLCFLANLFCSPYGKYNRILKKTNAYLKQCIATKTMPNMTKISLPQNMLQDLEKGKLTEVDAINGAVSDYGRKVGCPTPMNDRVVEIIHRIEQGELKPCVDNLKYFA